MIAGTVAPGGQLFVRWLGRADEDEVAQRPWLVSRRHLGTFAAEGLRETAFTEGVRPTGRPNVIVTYER